MDHKQILEMAIEREVEAYEFYSAVAAKDLDPFLKKLFTELAEEEADHKKILEAFIKNPEKPLHFKQTKDYKVAETVDKPALSIAMKPADALALAMKREEEAMDLYNEFAEASETEEQKAIFIELAKMEQGHKTRLEDLYTNAAFPEVW
jgi:rubrerythrin